MEFFYGVYDYKYKLYKKPSYRCIHNGPSKKMYNLSNNDLEFCDLRKLMYRLSEPNEVEEKALEPANKIAIHHFLNNLQKSREEWIQRLLRYEDYQCEMKVRCLDLQEHHTNPKSEDFERKKKMGIDEINREMLNFLDKNWIGFWPNHLQ